MAAGADVVVCDVNGELLGVAEATVALRTLPPFAQVHVLRAATLEVGEDGVDDALSGLGAGTGPGGAHQGSMAQSARLQGRSMSVDSALSPASPQSLPVPDPVVSVAFCAGLAWQSRRLLVTGHSSGFVRVWQLVGGDESRGPRLERLFTRRVHKAPVTAVHVSM